MDVEDIISVIIPTLNEEEGIEEVIEGIPFEDLKNRGYEVEVLVVDGGSSDKTVKKVKDLGYEVINVEGGKAEGVRKGLQKVEGRYVFLIDGDGSYPSEKIKDMTRELENGNDMILGSRFEGKISNGAMSTKNRIGNKILTWMANKLYGTEVSDLCTGLRGFEIDGIECGDIPGQGFEIEAGLHTIFSDEDISELGIRYVERRGESKLRTKDGFKIAARLIREKFGKSGA